MEPRSGPEESALLGGAPREDRLGPAGLFAVAAGSLLAVPGVFLDLFLGGPGFLVPIVGGPLVEEALKPAGLLILLSRRPELRLGAPAGIAAGAFSGLVFASIENIIYMYVYVPHHSAGFLLWRWTVCLVLHATCSALVGYGLSRASRERHEPDGGYRLLAASAPHLLEAPRERSPVFQGASLRCLVVAVAIHGAYNLAVLLLRPLGGEF